MAAGEEAGGHALGEPPKTSLEKPPIVWTSTCAPHFSPKRAIALEERASSIVIMAVVTSGSHRIGSFTEFPTCWNSSSVIGGGWVKSKRSRSGVMLEQFRAAWSPCTILRAWCSRCVAVCSFVVISE